MEIIVEKDTKNLKAGEKWIIAYLLIPWNIASDLPLWMNLMLFRRHKSSGAL